MHVLDWAAELSVIASNKLTETRRIFIWLSNILFFDSQLGDLFPEKYPSVTKQVPFTSVTDLYASLRFNSVCIVRSFNYHY